MTTQETIQKHFFSLANKYGNAIANRYPGLTDVARKELVETTAAAHLSGALQAVYFLLQNDGRPACNPQNLLSCLEHVGADLGLEMGSIREKPPTDPGE